MHPVQVAAEAVTSYESPASLEEALDLLGTLRERARPLAGGTDLLLELERGARAGTEMLVDLSRIPGLAETSIIDGTAHLGPMVTHNQVVASPALVEGALPLAQACLELGSPQLRNRATVAGNLVTASPANDTISALLALDATVTLRSTRGERTLPLNELYLGFRRTALEPDELLVDIAFPVLSTDRRGLFVKLGLRRAQAISVVHLAIVVDLDGDVIRRGLLAIGSVAPVVLTVPAFDEVLRGARLDQRSITAAAAAAVEAVVPVSDLRATADYRREEVGVMVRRALEALAAGRERERWPERPALLWGAGDGRVPALPPVHLEAGDTIEATINGTPVRAGGAVGTTLLGWLRDHAHHTAPSSLTGTKEGCAEGECGACTVHLDGLAVMACLVPAGRAHGAQITTVEGLASPDGRLHPIQQAFVDCTAVQCGYCIPGFLMAGAKLGEECPDPCRADVEAALAGNLCRCTGYYRIIEAVCAAAAAPGEGGGA